MRDREIYDRSIERLVVSATRLWQTVMRSQSASAASRASLALVALGLARSLDELAEAIEIVLFDGDLM